MSSIYRNFFKFTLLVFISFTSVICFWVLGCQNQEQAINTPEKDYTISGNVLTTNGESVQKATVKIYNQTNNLGNDETDATGHYSISGIPPGEYTISCEKNLFTSWIGLINIGNNDKTYNMNINPVTNLVINNLNDWEQLKVDDTYIFRKINSPFIYNFIGWVPGRMVNIEAGVEIQLIQTMSLDEGTNLTATGSQTDKIKLIGSDFLQVRGSTSRATYQYCLFDSTRIYAYPEVIQEITFCKFTNQGLGSHMLNQGSVFNYNTFESTSRGIECKKDILITNCWLKGFEQVRIHPDVGEYAVATLIKCNLTSGFSPGINEPNQGMIILNACYYNFTPPINLNLVVIDSSSSPRTDAGCGW